MDNFAEYILSETDLAGKMEIVTILKEKKKKREEDFFFDKTVVFKTEILRLFLDVMKIEDVDRNILLTASLLCNCKKVDNAQDLGKLRTYAKEGADFLLELGFNKKFCTICEQLNRYSGSTPRTKEGDILELVDQFGGMLLDRPERKGFQADEAIVLLENRNLKNEYNSYLSEFKEFVDIIEEITVDDVVSMKALRRLTKIEKETKEVKDYIKKIIYDYEPKVNKLINEYRKEISKKILNKEENPNRPLFTKETAEKIMKHKQIIEEENN